MKSINKICNHRYSIRLLLVLLAALIILQRGIQDVCRTVRPVVSDAATDVTFERYADENGRVVYGTRLLLSESASGYTLHFQLEGDLPENAGLEVMLVGETDGVYYSDYSYDYATLLSHGTDWTLDYAHVATPSEYAWLWIITREMPEIQFSDIQLSSLSYSAGWDALSAFTFILSWIVMIPLAALLLYALALRLRGGRYEWNIRDIARNHVEYFIVILLSCILLAILYRHADLGYPLVFHMQVGDENGYAYNTARILADEWYLLRPESAGPYIYEQFDTPSSEWMQLILLRMIGLLTQNVYLLDNLFYLLSPICSALTAVWACRRLGLSKTGTIVVSMLFAFSPFMQSRYEHLWLTMYFMIPVAIVLAVETAEPDTVINDADSRRRAFALGMLCAYTGLYYAYFSCAIFCVALVVRFLRVTRHRTAAAGAPVNAAAPDHLDQPTATKQKGDTPIQRFLRGVAPLAGCLLGVMLAMTPHLLYLHRCGRAVGNDLDTRPLTDAERFSLRLVQMLMPREGHRIRLLREWAATYRASYEAIAERNGWGLSYFVNENISSALGAIAVIGLIISLLWLLRSKRTDRQHTLAALNISLLLIASSGGLGVFLSYLIPSPVRAYNRMSLMIMFISLVCFVIVLERVIAALPHYFRVVIPVLTLGLGLYDQTITYVPYDEWSLAYFDASTGVFSAIGEIAPPEASVYVYPYLEYPRYGNRYYMYAPVEAPDIRWSCPAMVGRPEAVWQEMLQSYPPERLVELLRACGYDGLYYSLSDYAAVYGADEGEVMLTLFYNLLGAPKLVGADGAQYYWEL